MNQEKVLKVLLGPVVSEKTTMGSINNQYVFRVTPDSNKREIRTAVETLFGVKVEAVTTLNVKGKKKMFKVVTASTFTPNNVSTAVRISLLLLSGVTLNTYWLLIDPIVVFSETTGPNNTFNTFS
jgi:large subunit ribosomal protein L23